MIQILGGAGHRRGLPIPTKQIVKKLTAMAGKEVPASVYKKYGIEVSRNRTSGNFAGGLSTLQKRKEQVLCDGYLA
jgi:hypothetical protein